MIQKKRRQLLPLYIGSDLLAIVAAFFGTYLLRFRIGVIPVPKGIPPVNEYLIILPFLVFVHLAIFSYQEFYKIKLKRNRLDDLFLVIWNALLTAVILLFIFSYFKSYRLVHFEISRAFLMVYVPLVVFFIVILRLFTFALFKRTFLKRNGVSRVIIAGEGDLAQMTADSLRRYRHFGIEVLGFLATKPGDGVLGGYGDLKELVRCLQVTDLFIALPLKEYDNIMALIEVGNNLLLDIRLVPDILQLASLKAGMEHIEGIPVINLRDIPLEGWKALLKRLFDILFSTLALALALPLFLFITVLIKLNSSGPVFYRQTRVGLDGKTFRMIKFRTMIRDAEKSTGPIWSPQNDERVTRVGRLLRKTSFDELPQLLNVLKGDMSLVGPRPERPELVEKFQQSIPRYMLRHRVKAGMAGWAQVHGLRQNTPLDKRIEFDIYYIQNWTFRLDMEILFRTLVKLRFIDRNAP